MRYTARQRFALHGRELINDIEVTNRGEAPMPAGIGVHPWFPFTTRARMTAATPLVWMVDAEYMPTGRQAPPERLDFTRGLAFAGSNVANCYSGWDGRAVIEWPEEAMRLTMLADPPLTHLVLYAPDGGDFFCVEPVSNAVDAFNLGPQGVPDVGYRLLSPGETLAARVRFVTEFLGA
jgi:aldose 1-epimerase